MTVENRTGRAGLGTAAQRCVACDHPLEGTRCGHCGAAATAGRFTVLKQIAQTPRGRMYLAQDDQGRRVALKEVVFSAIPGLAQLESFRREARLLAELDHPAIPRFVDSFEEGTGVGLRLYIAQEFLEGESLLTELERRRFDEDEIRKIAEQVLEILVWLQRLSPPIFHRDLKPANLIRRPDGKIGLVDFGSARDSVLGTLGATMEVGTFGYVPPEQLGGEVDATSDLYALGTTLIHLLSRKPPREALAGNGFAALTLTNRTRAFLERLIAPIPAERFRGAAEALHALRTGAVRRDATRPGRNLAPAFIAVGFAMVAIGAVVAASFLGGTYVVTSTGPIAESAQSVSASDEPVVRTLKRRAWDSTELGADPVLEKMILRDLAVAGTDGDELRGLVETERRSLFALENLKVLRDAQERHHEKTGSYLAFEAGTAATWQTLGITLAEPQHHVYSASVVDGKLSMAAVGNLDDDAVLDRWSSSDAVQDGSPIQTSIDTFNLDYVTNTLVVEPSEGVPPLVREIAVVHRRGREARTTLQAIYSAEGIYKQGHGSYLEFESLTPDVAQRLGVTLPAKPWHRYSASMKDGKLVLRASGDLDGDPGVDEWRQVGGDTPSHMEQDWQSLGPLSR